MSAFLKNISVLFILCRGYSLPISIMSWLVPFLFAALNGGKILFGVIAGIGIVILHLATNLFDDICDYLKEKKAIEKGEKTTFNFQEGKCICILTNQVTLKQAITTDAALFCFAFLICILFLYFIGLKILYVIIPGAILCLLYPVLGCLGLGEILVGIIFSPIIYSGVYVVMTGNFSLNILLISISTGILTIAVLHNHMLLDYKYDAFNRKITLCRLSGNEFNSFLLLIFFIAIAYINLLICVFYFNLSLFYLLPFMSLFQAVKLINQMYKSIINTEDKTNFLNKFMLAQNLLTYFTILLCISIILDRFI